MTNLNEIITAKRKEKGLTQEKLASMIGVSTQAVSKWENGANMPDILLLPVIADIFEITVDELFGKAPKAAASQTITIPAPKRCEDAPEAAYTAILKVLGGISTGSTDSDFAEKAREYHNSNKANQTMIGAACGDHRGVYACRDIAFTYMKGIDESLKMLTDEKVAGVFAVFADPDCGKLLLYVMENKHAFFTAASAAAKLQMEEAAVENALSLLIKLELLHQIDVELEGNNRLAVYQQYAAYKMMLVFAMCCLAERLADYHENYYGFMGNTTI